MQFSGQLSPSESEGRAGGKAECQAARDLTQKDKGACMCSGFSLSFYEPTEFKGEGLTLVARLFLPSNMSQWELNSNLSCVCGGGRVLKL